MAHTHDVYDSDTHFVIDSQTMAITCATEVKPLKCGDHKAEKYTFELPRYIEGHDMSLCNKVEVHYNNLHYDKETGETTTNSSFDEVEDFTLTDDETIAFVWYVKGDATQLDGTWAFCIRFACMNGEEIEYQKFTDMYEIITDTRTNDQFLRTVACHFYNKFALFSCLKSAILSQQNVSMLRGVNVGCRLDTNGLIRDVFYV